MPESAEAISPAPAPDPGDVPISLYDRTLPLQAAARIIGMPENTLRQWYVRGSIPESIGGWRGGLRRFSRQDCIAIRTMRDLSRLGLPLAPAGVVALMVAEYSEGFVARVRTPERENRCLLVFHDPEAGMTHVCWANGDGRLSPMPPQANLNEETQRALRGAHVVVPATAIVIDVLCASEGPLEVAGSNTEGAE